MSLRSDALIRDNGGRKPLGGRDTRNPNAEHAVETAAERRAFTPHGTAAGRSDRAPPGTEANVCSKTKDRWDTTGGRLATGP